MDQNWCGDEELLKFLKCFFRLFCENKFLLLEFTFFSALEYVWNVCGHPTKCINETAIEICKPKEFLNVFEWFWEWLFHHGFNTTRVYWDIFLAYYEPHELDLYGIKDAFAKFNK